MKVLVLGGYGAVGRHVVAALREAGDTAYTAGRDTDRADRVVDLRHGDLPPAALDGIDVVVNAAGVELPGLVAQATDAGAAFVDMTASTGYVYAVEAMSPAAPVVLSVGLAPGLTTLLAAAAYADSPGPVDIALVLGAGEKHGPAATAWSYDLLGRRFPDTGGGPPVRNYTRGRPFALPGLGRRRLYRADFSDQHTLTRDLGAPVRTYFGMDSRAATAALALLTRVPGGSRAPRGLHLPGSDRWLAYARTATGRACWAQGRSQSRATAVVTVRAARRAVGLDAGVHHVTGILSLAELAAGDEGIAIHTPAD
ncbi:NAD-dependent epimerase/dehydratase family protein [Streptodolium elevatio]|uniref:NAD-dependent epimerase/dehydratase family protein n=1 Tax=Streptodolium elevatio TaxID=3157996 RepID=A0ABV3DN08_9ACTN